MRLTDLRPHFQKHSIEPADINHGRPLPDGTIQWGGFPTTVWHVVGNLCIADRISFLCPKCFLDNGGPVGTHRIAIDFVGRSTPDEDCVHNDQGQPVRWTVRGTDFRDLSLEPSIQLLGGCAWHGFVELGGIRMA